MRARRGSSLWLSAVLATALPFAGCSSSTNADTSKNGNADGFFSRLLSSTKPVILAAGTPVEVVLDQSLSSRDNRSGDEFDATLLQPIVVDGKTIVPKDAHVKGRVVEARESGRLETPGLLRIALDSIEVNGNWVDVETNAITRAAGSHKDRNLVLIGGGTGLGALVGGLAGGGKGALIGGVVGAGAGTAGAAITGKKDVSLAAETPLSFKLAQPVTVKVRS